ncbi:MULTISPECIES: MFS transporter [Pseudomonas]|jgi:MHS family alpha-ketoglutarate permease-like MFS transporter|uniref:MFS transporter, MHS family, alpha-ketoglutarate permease n=1 Tax=Phytopseudomonas argentinensis TaxID=289370 RepID=A0A1I3MJG3_9GAMM|nr:MULTISPECIES: MFS transporter [Pseudomonas]KAB0546802.1 MFS transporter [Pseudomonas argentinensis]MBD9656656.1 MFS transporter [Pseudomonas sp. PDM12]PZW45547.1 MHS family alpha-ketoglutarate permease-like MFS transporter [Pseudomonas sp. URMO17WK12:I2]CAH0191716.1 Alpha-ketoglutarate permease [Pseudomonas sp. Bi70]SFI96865.1 MFS transporter, MHS family, alpha-ketoglutarate permease [Pseudomonas argentinensis]
MESTSTLSASAPTRTTSQRIKSIFSGSVGNLVEWYDWYVYAAFSLYFAKAFFPQGDLTAQLLNTAAIFAVGFLMRPIGGWLMGIYADRKGRKAALLASVLLMCFGSLIIALTPSYETIGVAAPVLLVVARLLQGLSVGGEYGTSATYLSEMATKERRGFFSSFQYVTLISGQLIALAVLIILQQTLTVEQLETWGWRVPFVIGAMCAVVALYLRRGMEETDSFKKTEAPKENIMRTLLRHPKELLTVVGLTMGGTLAFYTYTTYMQKYLVNTVGMSKNDSTMISAATLFLFMLLQPLVGALSDKIGRRPILIAFGVLGTLFTYPILTTLHTVQSWWGAFFLIMAALIIVSGYTSINAVVKAELFPTEIRALGVGLPYALTVSIFGGTAEYVALWFKSVGMESGFYWYVTGCIACSLLVYITMKDTRTHSRITTD